LFPTAILRFSQLLCRDLRPAQVQFRRFTDPP
jgi:hypothetical protein